MKEIAFWILWIIFFTSVVIALTPDEQSYQVSVVYSALPNMTIDSCYLTDNGRLIQSMNYDNELVVTLKMNVTSGMKV